jgi:branched-chain amino acid transport system substrate-binding protein
LNFAALTLEVNHKMVSRAKLLSLLALAATALAACGSGSSGSSNGTIIIGVDAPISGVEAAIGVPFANGAKYVGSLHPTLDGFQLQVMVYDDTVAGVHNSQKAVQNVQAMASNANTLGILGPQESGPAQAMIPVANQAHLVIISGGATNPCLTEKVSGCSFGPSDLHPTGENNFFRTIGRDDQVAPADVDYAMTTLGIHNIAIFSDSEVYGKGIADQFQQDWIAKGGTVAVRQDFDMPNTTDFRAFITTAKAKGAQAFFAGASTQTKACVVRGQMQGIFSDSIPMLGSGLVSPDCISQAGPMANNIYDAEAVVDATGSSAAQAARADFARVFPNPSDYASYTLPMIASAQILVNAIDLAIKQNGGKMPTREQVLQQVAQTKNFASAVGTISFTSAGDMTPAVVSIYSSGGSPTTWTFIKGLQY